jgi:hypothetical protein
MKSTLRNLFLVSVFFFCIFNLKFSFLPFYTQRLVVVFGFIHIFITLTLSSKRYPLISMLNIIPIVWFTLFFVYCSVCYVVQESSDNSMIVASSLMLLQVGLSVIYLTFLCRRFQISNHRLLEILSTVFFIQACAVIAFFLSGTFRGMVSNVLPLVSDAEEWTFRSRGLTHGGGALLGLIQGIGALCAFYVFYFSKKFIKRLKYSLVFIIISISIVLSGRTGLLIFPLIMLAFIAAAFFYKNYRNKIFKNFIGLFSYSCLYISFFLLFYQAFFAWENKYGTDGLLNTLQWAFGEFVDFNADRYSDRENWATLKALFGFHVYFPNSFYGWLFGESSSWILMNPYGDMGYIRILYTNGLLGSFLLYGGYFSLFALGFYNAEKRFKLIFAVLFLYLFIAEIKEPFFFKFSVPTICLILLSNGLNMKKSFPRFEKIKSITCN